MAQSTQRFKEFKKALETQHGRPIPDEDVQKSIDLVELLAQSGVDIIMKEAERQQKLSSFPKGFHLDEWCTCSICNQSVQGENSWYDKDGIKCTICQAAINKRIIPRSLAQNKDSFYSEIELDLYFNLKGKVLNEFIKKEFLKVRIIPASDKIRHLRVFLLKDNKSFLPPKKLLSSHWVRDNRDGKEEFACMPWFYFHDPKAHLKKYQISQFLKTTVSPDELEKTSPSSGHLSLLNIAKRNKGQFS